MDRCRSMEASNASLVKRCVMGAGARPLLRACMTCNKSTTPLVVQKHLKHALYKPLPNAYVKTVDGLCILDLTTISSASIPNENSHWTSETGMPGQGMVTTFLGYTHLGHKLWSKGPPPTSVMISTSAKLSSSPSEPMTMMSPACTWNDARSQSSTCAGGIKV